MESIKNLSKKLLNPKVILFVTITILFIVTSIYAYNNFVKPRISNTYQDNNEFIANNNNESNKNATLYFFTADWCPISKKAKPEWDKLKQEYERKMVNGHTIEFIEVDCDKEPELADQFKIDSYPTIILTSNNQVIEYDANVKYNTLIQFLNSSLTSN